MVAWSSFGLKNPEKISFIRNLSLLARNGVNQPKHFNKAICLRAMSGGHDNVMHIQRSTFGFKKIKDMLHFYTLLGILLYGSVILYCHIFIGPAKLALIPEGYDPKPYEYQRHPISRFLAKYFVPSHQELHERSLHAIYLLNEETMLKRLENRVCDLVKQRDDYEVWYVRGPSGKYIRSYRKWRKENAETEIQQHGWVD